MTQESEVSAENIQIVTRWCETKGAGWFLTSTEPLGRGATASVYEVASPEGLRSIKIFDPDFSEREGEIGIQRIKKQIALGNHDCPSLVRVFEGGPLEDRLFLLMTRAPGQELEKCLSLIPGDKIRYIVDQIARAVIFLNSKGICHRDIKSANVFVSDDFNQATLLDISVMRDIYDPEGLGTDHDGQLPVVATTRYTPPEYLFRLLEPGPQLWHALDIYQLGALLHDLIMKQPLFQTEDLNAAENRYTLAWAVATKIPTVTSEEVSKDLIFTAQRALDKDWKRRSKLRVEDFLDDSHVRETQALKVLGLSTERDVVSESGAVAHRLQRVDNVAKRIQYGVEQFFRNKGVPAKHTTVPGGADTLKVIKFSWHTTSTGSQNAQRVEFDLELQLLPKAENYAFTLAATLRTKTDTHESEVRLELPEVADESGVESSLIEQGESAFATLAIEIMQQEAPEKE